MKLKVYSVYDKKTAAYYAPVCYHNDEHMMRDFGLSLSRNAEGPIVKYPQDYEVFQVGEWMDESGLLTPVTPVRWVCGVSAMLVPPAVEQADVIPFGQDIVPPSQESGGGQGPRKK